MRQYLIEIFYLLGPDRGKLPWLILLFLASSLLDLAGLGLVMPYVSLVLGSSELDGTVGEAIQWIGLPSEKEPLLLSLGFVMIAVFFCKAVAAIWINRTIIRFGITRQVGLRSFLMQAYQNLPYTEYLRRNSEEYIYSIQQLTSQYTNNVLIPMLQTLGNGIIALVIIVFLASMSPLPFLIMIVVIGSAIFIYDRLFRRKLPIIGNKANTASTKALKAIREGIEGLKEIRILGKENHFYVMLRDNSQEAATYWISNSTIASAPRYLLEFIMVTFLVAAVVVMLFVGGDPQALAPALALFGVAAMRLMPAINLGATSMINLRFYRNSVSRLYQDLKKIEERPGTHSGVTINADLIPFRSLRIDHARFHYPNADRWALDGIKMEIQAGQSIGLIGASGSGKTTLVDVLLGLLIPQEGQIYYNDRPLKNTLAEWRSQVAYLPQQVFLVDDTLRSNVALGVAEDAIDETRLNEALRQARLAELVEQLPQGTKTLLGERGVRLSGGQRQRVAIARAFYHGRDILVLDEATSALDNETESEIVEEIKRLKGKKTMIVIAHRLTTVSHCDRIYRLEDGCIVDSGMPETMLKDALHEEKGK